MNDDNYQADLDNKFGYELERQRQLQHRTMTPSACPESRPFDTRFVISGSDQMLRYNGFQFIPLWDLHQIMALLRPWKWNAQRGGTLAARDNDGDGNGADAQHITLPPTISVGISQPLNHRRHFLPQHFPHAPQAITDRIQRHFFGNCRGTVGQDLEYFMNWIVPCPITKDVHDCYIRPGSVLPPGKTWVNGGLAILLISITNVATEEGPVRQLCKGEFLASNPSLAS